MNKNTFTLVFTLFISFFSVAQKGIYKKDKIKLEKATDTLNVYFENNEIYVDVEIDNKMYKFFLDTGAITYIPSEIAEKLKPIGEAKVWDSANNSPLF